MVSERTSEDVVKAGAGMSLVMFVREGFALLNTRTVLVVITKGVWYGADITVESVGPFTSQFGKIRN